MIWNSENNGWIILSIYFNDRSFIIIERINSYVKRLSFILLAPLFNCTQVALTAIFYGF
jgi:hypothetical protein